jgi:hypothetical protein
MTGKTRETSPETRSVTPIVALHAFGGRFTDFDDFSAVLKTEDPIDEYPSDIRGAKTVPLSDDD